MNKEEKPEDDRVVHVEVEKDELGFPQPPPWLKNLTKTKLWSVIPDKQVDITQTQPDFAGLVDKLLGKAKHDINIAQNRNHSRYRPSGSKQEQFNFSKAVDEIYKSQPNEKSYIAAQQIPTDCENAIVKSDANGQTKVPIESDFIVDEFGAVDCEYFDDEADEDEEESYQRGEYDQQYVDDYQKEDNWKNSNVPFSESGNQQTGQFNRAQVINQQSGEHASQPVPLLGSHGEPNWKSSLAPQVQQRLQFQQQNEQQFGGNQRQGFSGGPRFPGSEPRARHQGETGHVINRPKFNEVFHDRPGYHQGPPRFGHGQGHSSGNGFDCGPGFREDIPPGRFSNNPIFHNENFYGDFQNQQFQPRFTNPRSNLQIHGHRARLPLPPWGGSGPTRPPMPRGEAMWGPRKPLIIGGPAGYPLKTPKFIIPEPPKKKKVPTATLR